MNAMKLLADIKFSNVIAEAVAKTQTHTGRAIANKYHQLSLSSHISCNTVNSFISEARNHMYDAGIATAMKQINTVLEGNTVTWSLATVCENINSNNSKFNSINRMAAEQVNTLLEGRDENEIIDYIKAGALKNVMHCEPIRRIAKSIFNNQPAIVESINFTTINPISYTETFDGATYFTADNRLFAMKSNGTINECNTNTGVKVSENFRTINKTISEMKYENEDFIYEMKLNSGIMKFTINESGDICRESRGESVNCTAAEQREFNDSLLRTINPVYRHKYEEILEGICKLSENIDSVCLIEEMAIYESNNGCKFSILDGEDNATFTLYRSNKQLPYTKTFDSIIEALNEAKTVTNTDVTHLYESQIERGIESNKILEAQQIQTELHDSKVNSTKSRVAALIEKYKNQPAVLAVLARYGEELSDM